LSLSDTNAIHSIPHQINPNAPPKDTVRPHQIHQKIH
jgi:hypothetical protein